MTGLPRARWRVGKVLAALGCACAAATSAWARGEVLVLNSGEASLSVVDMQNRAELRRIPVLREPHHLILSPDRRDLLVGDSGANEVLFLDPSTFEIKRRIPIADPYQLGFSPDGKYLVVNGLARAQVDVYDAATYKLVKRFPLASMPSHMAFAPDGSAVYVSLQGTGKLAALDLRHLAVLWEADAGKAPAGVMWHDGRVLVAIMGSDYVAVIDPTDGRLERRIHTGRGAHQLFLAPDRKLIYVNNRVDSTTVALDAASLAPVRSFPMPGGPDDIDFAPDGTLWITQRFAHKVSVLDPATGQIQSVDVGRSPHGLFVNARAQ
jgi:DNA-binding beta-propeller fold protein YncE